MNRKLSLVSQDLLSSLRSLRLRHLLFIACIGMFVVGCGSGNPLNRQAISGSVNFKNAPLDQGSISFEPQEAGGTTSGATINAGSYSIDALRGLPPGKYRVRINSSIPDQAAIAKKPPGGIDPPGIELIPVKYNAASEVFVEVVSGEKNRFDFNIE